MVPGDFVGRTAELTELRRALADGHRLVVLIGPPGAGKTALAERLRDGDGAGWVDVSQARDGDDLCATVARAFDVAVHRREEADRRLGPTLAAAGAPVVLDGFEQLVPHTELLGRWVADGAQLVVTSRQRLDLPEEVCIAVGPLACPAPGEQVPERIAATDAVRLFVHRARRVRPGYVPTDDELPVLGELVRRLDGLPLAIELCAARAGILGVRQLLAALDHRFALLRTPGGPSLEAVLDRSWAALDPWARRALAQCAVFRGSFDAAAAAAVLVLDDDRGAPAPATLDVLVALHDRSLLQTFPSPAVPGELRCRLLDSVRDFALARLREAGEEDEVRARHARHYAPALGEAIAAGLDRMAVTERLTVERDNLLAVVEWALAFDPPDDTATHLGLRAAAALEFPFELHGPLEPYERLLEALLARAPEHLPANRARMHRVLGWVRHRLGRNGAPDVERALRLARAADEPGLELLAGTLGALLAELRGDGDGARAALAELRPLLPRTHPSTQATYHVGHAEVLARQGDFAGALAAVGRAGRLAVEIGDRLGQLQSAAVLSQLHHQLGNLRAAAATAGACQPRLTALGERRLGAYALGILGLVAQEEGRLDEAERCLTEAWRIEDRLAEPLAHRFRAALGGLRLEQDRPADAAACYEAARAGFQRGGDVRSAARCLPGLALAAAALGAVGEAEAHLAACRREADFPDKDAILGMAAAMVADDRGQVPLHAGAFGTDARLVWRLARRRLGDDEDRELVVADDGTWFRAPGGVRVELGHRPLLQRLLRALADARRDTPGRSLDTATLVRAGWAGERILPDAASARLRVALADLRKLGLRGVLERAGGGWRLDPRVPLRRPVVAR